MIDRMAAHPCVGIADRAKLVLLILKEIGIDRASQHSILRSQALHCSRIRDSFRKIPLDMQSQSRSDTGERVCLGGVSELLLKRSGRSGLQELAKTGSGVGKTPRRNFDLQAVQGADRPFKSCAVYVHVGPPRRLQRHTKSNSIWKYLSIEILFPTAHAVR